MSHPDRSPHETSVPAGHALPRVAGGVGILGLGVLAVAFFLAPGEGVLASYLVAFLFFVSLALGNLFFVLLQWVTRAGWSVVVRRLAENVAATLPLFLVLAVPLALGVRELYPWADPQVVQQDPLLEPKEPFWSLPFFYFRGLVHLLSWGALAWWLRRESLRQDATQDLTPTRRLRRASAPGLVVLGLTVTFASFDWVMSLDPHWHSTIFGVYFWSGAVVGGLALLILTTLLLSRLGLLGDVVTVEHLHDLGKLLFGFLVFWTYIAFSQYLLIWYGNIPEETAWYAKRLESGWQNVTVALAVGHFVLPFFFLLPRAVKRSRSALLVAAVWLLSLHYLDVYWLVVPNFHAAQLRLSDGLTLVGLGGVFVGALGLLARRPNLIPVRDPRLSESLSFENS